MGGSKNENPYPQPNLVGHSRRLGMQKLTSQNGDEVKKMKILAVGANSRGPGVRVQGAEPLGLKEGLAAST